MFSVCRNNHAVSGANLSNLYPAHKPEPAFYHIHKLFLRMAMACTLPAGPHHMADQHHLWTGRQNLTRQTLFWIAHICVTQLYRCSHDPPFVHNLYYGCGPHCHEVLFVPDPSASKNALTLFTTRMASAAINLSHKSRLILAIRHVRPNTRRTTCISNSEMIVNGSGNRCHHENDEWYRYAVYKNNLGRKWGTPDMTSHFAQSRESAALQHLRGFSYYEETISIDDP